MTDEHIHRNGPEWTAVLRVVYTLTDYEMRAHEGADGPNIIQVAGEAQETLADIERRLSELESAVDTELHFREWREMTKKDKVRRLQHELAEAAQDAANGKAAMDYNDVRWLFNNRPSAGHCYNLMEIAAEAEGFNYDDRAEGQTNRITVNLDAVNADAVFHSVKKEEESNPA
jgi:nitrate reductase NapAB chaperone NapD